MKKLFKILSYFIIVIISLIIILTVIAKLSENKITGFVLKKVSEEIKAPVTINEVSFNLIRKFPLATIELNGVLLGSEGENKKDTAFSNGDTILSIDKIYVSVKSKPLLKGIFEIKKVDVNGAKINYLVDTSGVSNIDFLLGSSDSTQVDTTQSEPLNLTLTDLTIENVRFNIIDSSLKFVANILLPEFKVKADLKDDKIDASAKGNINLTNCSFEGTNLYLMKNTNIQLDVIYADSLINIHELEIKTDGANLGVKGDVILAEDTTVSISFVGNELLLGELIKYAPNELLNEFGLKKVNGVLNVSGQVNGIISGQELPQVDLNFNLDNGYVLTADYPELKNLKIKGNINNGILRNNSSTQVNINTLSFGTGQSNFNLNFSVLDLDHPKYSASGDLNINIDDFNNFIPDSLVKSIDGRLNINFSTKGELPDSITDDFIENALVNSRAEIKISDLNLEMDTTISVKNLSGQITYKNKNIEIEHLNLLYPEYNAKVENTSFNVLIKGKYDQVSNMNLDLKSLKLVKDHSMIEASAKVENFEHPTYSLESKMKINFEDFKRFIPDSLVNQLSGEVEANINSSGTVNLDSIADQMMEIIFKSSAFQLNFNHVSVDMVDFPLYKLENLTGYVDMKPQTIFVDKVSGIAAGIEFGIDSTTIENLYNTIIQNKAQRLSVFTNVSLGDLDYTMFAPFMTTDSTEKQTTNNEAEEATNYTMLVKGRAKVKSFKYNKAFVQEISTLFNVRDSVYILDQFKFKAFDGKMRSSVKYSIKPGNRSTIEMHNIVARMDVKKLLEDFDNFKDFYEPSITSENLSGLFSTDLYSRFEMVGDSMIQENTRIKGRMMLEDGGVYNFQPAMDMSKFTGINELDNIQFKTLESNIFMFKNKLYVPTTNIVSTALDITAYGMQSMGEDYEYHFQLHLGDILKGKSKKLLKEQSKSGDLVTKEDLNRSTVELIYSQIEGKSKTGFDTKSLQNTMKTTIRVQETMLNLVFYERLFNFDTKVNPDK